MGSDNRDIRTGQRVRLKAPKFDAKVKHITMWEMSLLLRMQPASMSKWVHQWLELGELAIAPTKFGKKGKPLAYSVPVTYVLVGRGWQQTKDPGYRDSMLQELPADPKPWIVCVGNRGYTCYTALQASERVSKLLTDEGTTEAVSVFYVGEVPE